jgi:hypothetical protein
MGTVRNKYNNNASRRLVWRIADVQTASAVLIRRHQRQHQSNGGQINFSINSTATN